MDGANTAALLTIDQVAERLAVSPRTVRRMVNDGSLPCVRVGRQIRFRPKDIESYFSDPDAA
ncbi:MAG TPA: helix-turn-helix domain-containing protein [Streptosporangiaceae bacterium]